jgi:hypothetical protein
VARVAAALLRGEGARQLRGEAVPLPVGVPAGHGLHVLVAELAESLGRERGAGAAGAVDDDRPAAVGGEALDARLEIPAGDVDGAGEVPLLPLVRLADVEEERPVGARCGIGGRDLVDLRLHLLE